MALARAAARAGTRTVVATPHRSRRWRTEPEQVEAGVARMRELYARDGVELELLPGAELAVGEAARLDDATLARLSLGGGPYLLIESPYEPIGRELERALSALAERGHGVVLAHPERCPAFLDRPQRLRALVEGGVLCSVTAGALAGRFGGASRWFALELVRDGLAHSVDSDAHDAARRPPGLREGLRAAAERLPGLERIVPWLAEAMPAAILAGDPLPPRPR
jgi:protein-tyrosine phosphatase